MSFFLPLLSGAGLLFGAAARVFNSATDLLSGIGDAVVRLFTSLMILLSVFRADKKIGFAFLGLCVALFIGIGGVYHTSPAINAIDSGNVCGVRPSGEF